MKLFRNCVFYCVIPIVIAFIFRNWFQKGLLTAPDFSYIYPTALQDFRTVPYAWAGIFGNGLGGGTFPSLNLNAYLHLGISLLVFAFRIPWSLAYRIMFFWPFVFVGFISFYYFFRGMVKNAGWAFIGSLIYLTNSYILMLAAGGQVGLMMAYAFAPLALAGFIRQRPLPFAAGYYFLLLFDLRYGFLITGVMAVYMLTVIPKRQWADFALFSLKYGAAVIFLHAFWVIPSLFARGLTLPEGYGNVGWLQYLSWADFSKTVSLLHPNFPENVFGKVYFMRPEFLLLPIVGFLAMTRMRMNREGFESARKILFFSTLALVGAFFAKGINPPFGGINRWFFEHVPFFNGFRDPTKFYILTALSYGLLIPFALGRLSDGSKPGARDRLRVREALLALGFIIFWLFSLRPLFLSIRPGTFGSVAIPRSYEQFADMAYADTTFSRTLAVPWGNRFIFRSEMHPVVNAREAFGLTDIGEIGEAVQSPEFEKMLRNFAVRYVVVPDDFTEEIFLKDRIREDSIRDSLIRKLDTVPYLKKYETFQGLIVYEFRDFTGHIFTEVNPHAYQIYPYRKISPVHYDVDVTEVGRPLRVVFSERYDPAWVLWDGGKAIKSKRTPEGMNSFLLDTDITGQVTIYHTNQRWLEIGYIITLASFGALIVWTVAGVTRRRNLPGILPYITLGIVTYGFFRIVPSAVFTNVFVSQTDQLRNVQKSIMDKVLNNEGRRLFMNTAGNDVITFPSGATRACISSIRLDVSEHRCLRQIPSCNLSYGTEQRSNRGQIGIVGDSISIIHGSLNYTRLLSGRLGSNLINKSVYGATVTDVENHFSAKTLDVTDLTGPGPDLLVIFLGTNDLSASVNSTEFVNNYSQLLSRIRKRGFSRPLLLVGLLKRSDFSREAVRTFSQNIRKVARESGAYYIDPYDFLDLNDIPDGIHPAMLSQRALADRFFSCLRLMPARI